MQASLFFIICLFTMLFSKRRVQVSPRRIQGIGLTDGEQLKALVLSMSFLTNGLRRCNLKIVLTHCVYHYGERIIFQIGIKFELKDKLHDSFYFHLCPCSIKYCA